MKGPTLFIKPLDLFMDSKAHSTFYLFFLQYNSLFWRKELSQNAHSASVLGA